VATSFWPTSRFKSVTIPSKEAYGERVEELVQKVDRNQLPPDLNPEVGQKLVATNDMGQQQHVTVVEVTEESMTIDGNHDLAGKDLVFDIELVDIQS
jgi:FKBP-type peptidyl-prolyl cis-trans isomerase 2